MRFQTIQIRGQIEGGEIQDMEITLNTDFIKIVVKDLLTPAWKYITENAVFVTNTEPEFEIFDSEFVQFESTEGNTVFVNPSEVFAIQNVELGVYRLLFLTNGPHPTVVNVRSTKRDLYKRLQRV